MRNSFKHTYYNTYYYANIVDNVLKGDIELLGFICNFFEGENLINHLIKPFQKRNAFQVFIEHVLSEFFEEDMFKHDESNYKYCQNNCYINFKPYADSVFEEYGIKGYSLEEEIRSYIDVEKHQQELIESGILWELYRLIGSEIFYFMFNNRDILLRFNLLIAQVLQGVNYHNFNSEGANYFNKKGVLKRARIPEWCKTAVFFRDRGRCCFCHQNLSGTLSMDNNKHYDHIVPLGKGGLNDVANIQLLCSSCNLNKGEREIKTSNIYERWY